MISDIVRENSKPDEEDNKEEECCEPSRQVTGVSRAFRAEIQ